MSLVLSLLGAVLGLTFLVVKFGLSYKGYKVSFIIIVALLCSVLGNFIDIWTGSFSKHDLIFLALFCAFLGFFSCFTFVEYGRESK